MGEDSMPEGQHGYQMDVLSSSMVQSIEQRIEQVKDEILKQVLRRGALLRSTGASRRRIRSLKAEAKKLRASAAPGTASPPVDTQIGGSRGVDAPGGTKALEPGKTAKEPSASPHKGATVAPHGGHVTSGTSGTSVMHPRRWKRCDQAHFLLYLRF